MPNSKKTLPEQLTDAEALVGELTAKIESLNAQHGQAVADGAAAVNRAETAEAQVAALTTEKGKLESNAAALKSEVENLQAANKELTAKEQDIERRASARATEIMASVGQPEPVKSAATNGRESTTASGLTGLQAVEAMYHDKYEAGSVATK